MTTDNRTNVQIVADALRSMPEAERDDDRDPAVVVAEYAVAALVAAQGAAPQAEAYDHCCNHPKCPGGSLCCCVSEQRLRDCWNQWLLEISGDTKQAFRDGYQAGQNDPAPWLTAPVLPSSGADEDVLAEVEAERDAALARIAELGQSLRSESLARGVDTTLLREYERRFAEAAKLHRRRDDLEYRWGGGPVCDGCGDEDGWASKWPCPTAVALGLDEGGSDA